MKRKQDYSKLINIPVVILLSMFLPYPHPSCLQTAKAVVPPVCPIRVLWSSQVEGCALSPLSIPAPLLADKIISLQPLEREREYYSDHGNLTKYFLFIPSPCDLPEPSLPSSSDLHLFPSWPHTSLHQCLLSPPSVPTKSSQLKPFFVWSIIIQVPELLPGVSEGFHIKLTLNKNCNSV